MHVMERACEPERDEFVRKGCAECKGVQGGVAVCEKHWSECTHKPGDYWKR